MDFWMNENKIMSDFNGEEIATFKRYIEENDVYNDNSFEFFEKNLNYFSSRHTRDEFDCLAECFHINSNFWNSDEIEKNISLYEKSIYWRNKTVHPEDSEYVIKEEKYLFLDTFPEKFRKIVEALNDLPMELFSCVDLLFYVDDVIYQYLPNKNFLFTWNKDGRKIIRRVSALLLKELVNQIVVIPIFIPIRKMLFLGEYGYREAIVDYGRVISEIMHCMPKSKLLQRFENQAMNQEFHLDGVEKSIMSIIIY